MKARLSILGLYNYDDTLFDNLTIPTDTTGAPVLDKDVLVDMICLESAQLATVYPDADVFKAAVKVWSVRKQRTIAKIMAALSTEYAPLENYDRYEDAAEGITNTGTQGTTTQSADSVAAFNSASLEPSAGSTGSSTTTNNLAQDTTRTSHVHGNIGVTTSQQMLTAELGVAVYDAYSTITELFI